MILRYKDEFQSTLTNAVSDKDEVVLVAGEKTNQPTNPIAQKEENIAWPCIALQESSDGESGQ